MYNRYIKTASKEAIQKTTEATGDLIGNKIADEITSVSKRSNKNLPTIDEGTELTTDKKKIYITKRKAANYWWIKVSTYRLKNCVILKKRQIIFNKFNACII